MDSYSLEYRLVAHSCEHSNEPSDSIKGKKFFDWLCDY